jgi:hypothetical protein
MNQALKAIEALARKLAEKAGEDSISVSEMTEAAKALAPYYNHLKKAEGKSDEDSPDDTTMSGLQDAVRAAEGVEDGRTVSRNHRRRN